MIQTYTTNSGGTYVLPDYIHAGLLAYLEHGDCGGFLEAALANDFLRATGRADRETAQCLVDLADFICNEMPAPCHGSPEAVRSWRERCEVSRAERHFDVIDGAAMRDDDDRDGTAKES